MIRNGISKGRLGLDDTHTRLPNPRKPKKLSLHSLNSVEPKLLAGIPDAHKEQELLTISKMAKKNTLNDVRTENILQRIMPKYKPNSKGKATGLGVGTGQGATNPANLNKDKLIVKASQIHALKQPSTLEINRSCTNSNASSSTRSGSCMKIHNPSPVPLSKNPPPRKSSKVKTGKKTTKVRFDKKVTIHYVPSDEDRGSYEWRKNLTRQGIYQAMLWKTELEKLEMEEANDLIKSTTNSKEALAAYCLD